MGPAGGRGSIHPIVAQSRMITPAAWLRGLLLFYVSAAAVPVFTQTPDTLLFDTLRTAEIRATRLPVQAGENVLSVSSLGRDQLHTAQAQLSLAESLGAVPGVFTLNDANFSQDLRISIRGFGARAGFGIRGIKVLLDGIPESAPDGQAQVDNLDMAAVSRLEVLRGASGGLWGNASGGVLSLSTDDPPGENGQAFASGRFAAGAFGFRQMHVKAGIRTGKIAATASMTDQRLDGYREHAVLRARLTNAKIVWSPDSTSSLKLLLNHTDSPRADDPGGLTAAQADTVPRAANAANVRFQAGESLRQGRAALVYEKKLGQHQTLRLRSYAARRDFENRLPFQNGGQVAFQRFFVGGGGQYDWAAASLPIRLTAGFDLDRQADERQRFFNNDGLRGDQNLDQTEIFTGAGAYALAHWSPGRFTLSGGLRYDAVLLRADDHFLSDGDQSGRERFRQASPWAGVVYRIRSKWSVYANATTNFETPTLTELSNNPAGTGGFSAQLGPQRTLSLEAGLRGHSGQGTLGRLAWELAFFRTRTRDELTPYEIAGQPGRTYYRNAGAAIRQGLEASVQWFPVSGLALLATYAYSDFYFETYTTPVGDFAGNRLPGLPRQHGQAELRWRHNSGFFAFGTARLTGAFFADDANTVRVDQFIWLKARAGWQRRFGPIAIEIFAGADNLGDVRYYNNVRPNAAAGRYFESGAGRTWLGGVSLAWRH